MPAPRCDRESVCLCVRAMAFVCAQCCWLLHNVGHILIATANAGAHPIMLACCVHVSAGCVRETCALYRPQVSERCVCGCVRRWCHPGREPLFVHLHATETPLVTHARPTLLLCDPTEFTAGAVKRATNAPAARGAEQQLEQVVRRAATQTCCSRPRISRASARRRRWCAG